MKNKRKKYYQIAAFFISLLLAYILINTSALEFLELKSLDFRFRMFDRSNQASKNVVLITIDEKSLVEFKKNKVYWQWPRNIYAILNDYLNDCGAKAIVYDMVMADPDIDRLDSEGYYNDSLFISSVQNFKNLIIAAQLTDDPGNSADIPDHLPGEILFDDISWISYTNAILPFNSLLRNSKNIAFANLIADKEDSVCRRLPLVAKVSKGNYLPQLAFSSYFNAVAQDKSSISFDKDHIKFDNKSIPLDGNGNYLINWYGKGGVDGVFKYYSFVSVFSSAVSKLRNEKPLINENEFKDKYIIIGSNATALFDFKETPFTYLAPYPGMEISATIISNLLQHFHLERNSKLMAFVLSASLSLLILLTYLFLKRYWKIIIVSVSIVTIYLIIVAAVFDKFRFWVDVLTPLTVTVFSVMSLAIISYIIIGKEKKYIQNAFSRYLSTDVIDEILSEGKQIELGGKEIVGSVLFSDLKDFTTLSETTKPDQLVDMLNKYFSISVQPVLQNRGLLDKFIGDSIMALFGAPFEHKEHAFDVCRAALNIQKKIDVEWNDNKYSTPRTRIGISTGKMIVGNIGTSDRVDYTAIGDTVNIASRLESLNKFYKTDIIISENTYMEIKDKFLCRKLDKIKIKGKNKILTIYELIEEKCYADQNIIRKVNDYNSALDSYYKSDFETALNKFKSLKSLYTDDKVIDIFINRSEFYISNPPNPNWDGIYEMEAK